MFLDPDDPVVSLCSRGTRAEFEQQPEQALACYQQAWTMSESDLQRAVAAHYLARLQATPEQMLDWNQRALAYALSSQQPQAQNFLYSLYLSLGASYQALNQPQAARVAYQQALEAALSLSDPDMAEMVSKGILAEHFQGLA